MQDKETEPVSVSRERASQPIKERAKVKAKGEKDVRKTEKEKEKEKARDNRPSQKHCTQRKAHVQA